MRYLIFIILFLISCKTIKNSEKENYLDKSIEPEIKSLKINSKDENDNPEILKSEKLNNFYNGNDIKVVNYNIINNKEINHNISNGQIVYRVPDTMQVMKKYDIIVRISKSQDNISIIENINGKITKKNIITSSRMEVNLIDVSESFIIKKVNTDKQIIDSTYTEWLFSVMPIKPGINKLNLVVSIIKGDDVKQTVYSDNIFVKSNTPAQIKKFWYENWKWSMDKFIIPILTWFLGIWIGIKRNKKKI
jgi:hypothetical protein